MTRLITEIFRNRLSAEEALTRLEAIGVRERQISLLLTDETRGRHFKLEKGSKADEGAAAGATAGGLVGAVLGALLAAGAVAIPGMNIVVTGALVSGLAGAGAGAAIGGLAGALVGMGIPEAEAKLYESAIREGSVFVAVKPENDEQGRRIRDILDQARDDEVPPDLRARRRDAGSADYMTT